MMELTETAISKRRQVPANELSVSLSITLPADADNARRSGFVLRATFRRASTCVITWARELVKHSSTAAMATL